MLNFVKMHGAGNDYIYVKTLGQIIENPSEIAKKFSMRRYSVGADGLVLIYPSKIADAKIRIFNADGSEAKICGNALRCVAKLLYEDGIIKKSHIKIECQAGIRDVFLIIKDRKVGLVTVDMGIAVPKDMFLFEVHGEKYEMRAVNIGNDHQVTFLKDVDALPLDKIGKSFESNSRFEDGVNTEFCEILDKNHLKVRVFERGSGETLACGSGACASAVAAISLGFCDFESNILVNMPGGNLIVKCERDYHTYLSGNAQRVFEGIIPT